MKRPLRRVRDRLGRAFDPRRHRRLLILPPILLGIFVLVLIVALRSPPEQKVQGETVTKARVVEAVRTAIRPRAIGYGVVRPNMDWAAVAQVGGKVESHHPNLKRGAVLAEGTEIISIDQSDYLLAIDRLQADVTARQAQIEQLDVRKRNLWQSLKIEKEALALAERDVERKKELLDRGTVPQISLDRARQEMLGQRRALQNMQNEINTIPSQQKILESQLKLAEAQLADAELALERTVIRMPFDGRIAEVNIERTQYVAPGQVLARADSLDRAEITAQLPVHAFVAMIEEGASGRAGGSLPAMAEDAVRRPVHELDLDAIVRLASGGYASEWRGHVVRLSDRIDPQTRTIGVVVAVDDPYRRRADDGKPALTKDMYVEVEIVGPPRHDRLAVPRIALHGSRLYVVNAEDRLEIRDVTVSYRGPRLAVITDGLMPGERVIVSDLIPAIPGMRIDSVEDESLARELLAQAGDDDTSGVIEPPALR